MLRTQFVSYLKNGLRLNAINSRNVTFSAIRLCKAEVFEDDFHEPRYKRAVRNRLSSKKYPHSSKSVLFSSEENASSVLFDSKNDALYPLNSCDSCNSVEEVLTYLKNNPEIPIQHYASTYDTIFKLYKSKKSKLSPEQICRRKEFELLSKNVNRDVRFLTADDAVKILKTLTYFGIPTNSLLCQSLLQMISKHINKLGILQILFLYSILDKSSPSPLAEGLKIALPMVFEAHVRSQLDRDDTYKISSALRFAFRRDIMALVTNETRNLLVDTALEKIDCFNASVAFETMIGLHFRSDSPENTGLLFKKLVCILTKNMDQLNSDEIIKIVKDCVDKYFDINESFFDENLVKTSIQYFIEHQISLGETGNLLRQLSRVSYYCPELLDYYDSRLKLSADSIDSLQPRVTAFIRCCADCMYKPKNWNSYELEILSFLESRTKQNGRIEWIIRVVNDVLILKCFPKTLVDFCFQNGVLHEKILSRDSKHNLIRLLKLYHVVKLLYSNHYDGPDPPARILEKAVTKLSGDKNYPLLDALQVGLGGPQYVLRGVKTKLGQVIDYLIVKRISGEIYPLTRTEVTGKTGNSDSSYESLNIPEDSYSIAILLLEPVAYCLDGYRLTGGMEIEFQCLQACGITALPISHYRWLELEDAKKIPYLVDKINQCVPVPSSYKRSNENY